MKSLILISVFTIGLFSQLWSYDTNDSIAIDRKLALDIYLDCPVCDLNYFKENFSVVNYVREPEIADVQIQIITLTTGSGGTEYNLFFHGRKNFKNVNDTLIFSLPPDKTFDETRKTILQKIQLGLVPYLMKTAYAKYLYLLIDNIAGVPLEKKDPWKKWMFDIYGSALFSAEKYTNNLFINTNLYISKITSNIKFESNINLMYNENHINNYPLGDTTLSDHSYLRSYFSNNLFVKSMGEHFGIGGMAIYRNNKIHNLDYQMRIGPAIEYNIFKYSDASNKQLRFLYFLGYEENNYCDSTIYYKMNDYLYTHNLRILFTYLKPWGYFNTSIYGSNYLNDFSFFSLGTNALANIRIVKGLSFNFSCGINMYRDQIALRNTTSNYNDLLSKRRQIATDYSLNMNFGISFRFGSTSNNTVNPRFSN